MASRGARGITGWSDYSGSPSVRRRLVCRASATCCGVVGSRSLSTPTATSRAWPASTGAARPQILQGPAAPQARRSVGYRTGDLRTVNRSLKWRVVMIPNSQPVQHSPTWTFFEGRWHRGNVPMVGPRTHGFWLGSTVFDGARAFNGVTPDLDRHCARVNRSAISFGLKPVVDLDTWLGLAREGIARFAPGAELYVRPMYWPQSGVGGGVIFDPETTEWCLCIYEAPLPQPVGISITLSPFRRPT